MKRRLENIFFALFLIGMFAVGIIAAVLIVVGFSIAQLIAYAISLRKK